MASTPTNGHNSFPFAINCRLAKTFFGVPRKCTNCGKMIVLTAGFACQFCRFRCHRRCTGQLGSGRPKLCSLSQLPEGDSALFSKLARENEVNANDVDVFSENWASLLASTSSLGSATNATPRPARPETLSASLPSPERPKDLGSPLRPTTPPALPILLLSTSIDSLETLTSGEPQSPAAAEETPSPGLFKTFVGSTLAPPTESVMDRFLRMISWKRSESPSELDISCGSGLGSRASSFSKSGFRSVSSGPSSPTSVVTPVDEFNASFLEEMFLARSSSAAPARRRNWVHCIAGSRAAQSQDFLASPPPASPPSSSLPSSPATSADDAVLPPFHPLRPCSSWPLTGLHLNHDDADDDEEPPSSEEEQLGRASLRELGEWSIPEAELDYGDIVLAGRAVSTFAGKWHGDVMIHRYIRQTQADYLGFLHEIHILTKIRHENVALFMGACVDPEHMAIVTSIRKGGCLYDALHVKVLRFSHHSKVNIARQIAQGMGYLHAKGIVLKCLSTRSVFLECKVKICMVNYEGPDPRRLPSDTGALRKGALSYLSPELMGGLSVCPPFVETTTPQRKESDVYAFGTILYEIFSGAFPFRDFGTDTLIWLIGSGQRQAVDLLPCHVGTKSLIEECWNSQPSRRPHFPAILRHLHHTAALHAKHSSSNPEKLNRVGRSRPKLFPTTQFR